jgi:phage RecT family recombinase
MTAASKPNGVSAVPTPREKLKSELARYVPSYEKLLPPGYSADRLVTGAMVAVVRNPDLLKCTPQSIAVALAQIAQWNLDVGTTAHLVPYGTTCTAVADYKGYIEQMVKAGARKVEAHVVREGDEFEMERGTEPYLRHGPRSASAPITGAYAIVWLRGGVTQFEYMTVAEIDAIRQAKSQSWKKGDVPKWYARKTVVRQIAKYVPKNVSLARLLNEDEVEPIPGPASAEMLAILEPPHRGLRMVRAPSLDDPPAGVTADGEIFTEPAAPAVPADPEVQAALDLKEDRRLDKEDRVLSHREPGDD